MIELRLSASWRVRPDTRQLHGLACALFEGEGAEHFGADKPFAVWPLRRATAGTGLASGRAGSAVADAGVVVSALAGTGLGGSELAGSGSAVSWSAGSGSGVSGLARGDEWVLRAAWLRPGLPPAGAVAPERLRLGHVACEVTEAAHRSVSHAQLMTGPAVGSAELTFHSPAYFSQNGTDVVTPDPRLIAGSWRRRWNASLPEADPLAIGEDVWRDWHRGLRFAAFDLRTVCRDSGRGHDRAGFTGTATLQVARDVPASARAVFGTLARFAEFCGTGAQTTHGFGATTATARSQPTDGLRAAAVAAGPPGP